MVKIVTLLLTVLVALASAGGYVVIGERIADGERRIAEGERQLEEGRAALEKGQAELDAGEREVAAARRTVEVVEDIPFVKLLDGLLGGRGGAEADRRTAAGDEQVASGEGRIASGRGRIAAGEVELRRGEERLQTARRARVGLALGAVVFGLVSLVLGVRWRRSLGRTPNRTEA